MATWVVHDASKDHPNVSSGDEDHRRNSKAWFDVYSRWYSAEGGETVSTAVALSPRLSAVDRCDRCGAQAYVRVELASGGELLFCAHHARTHLDALQQVAASIHDETDRLADTPASAPEGEV
jgi:hypothetical protein